MPAAYQGTLFRGQGSAAARPGHAGRRQRRSTQRESLDLLKAAERASTLQPRPGDTELAARIAVLRAGLPDADRGRRGRRSVEGGREDARRCTAWTTSCTADFGRKCLITRRLLERGVRFVQLYSGGGHIEDTWDGHTDCITNHKLHAGETDQPIAALMADLKRTGLWDETLLDLGRRVRPHADERGRRQAGPRPQPVRLLDVAGRGRREGRPGDRRDRRAGLQGGRAAVPHRPTCTRRSCT